MSRTCFIIFAHSTDHTVEDLEDMMQKDRAFDESDELMIQQLMEIEG